MNRWLSLPHAAEYLDITTDSLRRLVRAGKLPAPDRSLGARMPRWDKEALDKAMDGTATSQPSVSDTDRAVEAWLEKQRKQPRRAANTR